MKRSIEVFARSKKSDTLTQAILDHNLAITTNSQNLDTALLLV